MSLKTGDSVYALVATTGYLLLVDIIKRLVVPLENHRPEYYGISWRPLSTELVLSHSGLDTSRLVDIATYATSETGYISSGKNNSSEVLSAPHQIFCASDGRIVCTNTGRNSITILDIDKPGHYQEKRLSSARWDRLSIEQITGDHLNSVFEKQGMLYVVAHGHHKGASLAVFNYPDLELVCLETIKNRTGLHNIWVTDEGQKICCHSNIGALIDLASDEVIWSSGSPVYTRGLAATTDYILVGESQMTVRNSRRNSISGLWIVDRSTLKSLDFICLGPYGAVHEVRLLNVPDLAHHGHVFTGLNDLLQLNLFAKQTEARLAASAVAAYEANVWSDFENIWGMSIAAKGGLRTASPDSLCIITKKAKHSIAPEELDFRYALDLKNADSHVSIIIYAGVGADTDMHAFLIRAVSETEASIGLWNHDGATWSTDGAIQAVGLPLSGHIQAIKNSSIIKISVNDQLVLSLASDHLPYMNGRLGIRWLGASIAPGKLQSDTDLMAMFQD